MTRRLLLLLLPLALGRCDCLLLPEPGPHGSGGGGGSKPGDVMVHEDCAGLNEELDLDAATAVLAQPTVADGVQELKVSASGCIVVRRGFVAGRLTTLSLRKYWGFATLLDGGITNPVLGEMETVWVDATFGNDGHNSFTMDSDGDRHVDYVFDESFQQGLLVSRVATWLDTSGAITRRTTVTPATANEVTWKIEVATTSGLAVNYETQVSAAQLDVEANPACYTMTTTNDETVPCPIDDAAIRKRLHDALSSFSKCLKDLGAGTFSLQQLEVWLLDANFANTVDYRCFKGNAHVGRMHLDTNVLDLNEGLFTNNCEKPAIVDSSIVHELLHRTRGPHDFSNPMGPYGPRARAGSDSRYACEELCFGGIRTKCTCARCLGVKACDSRCDSLPSCRVDNPDGGPALASEAVGTYCRTNNTWFQTKAACQATGACPNDSSGKSGCRSYSVSCDPNCN